MAKGARADHLLLIERATNGAGAGDERAGYLEVGALGAEDLTADAAMMPPPKRGELLRALEALLDLVVGHPELLGRDLVAALARCWCCCCCGAGGGGGVDG